MSGLGKRLNKRSELILAILLVVIPISAYVFAGPLVSSLIGSPLKTSPNLPVLDHYTIASDAGQQNPTLLTLWLKNDGMSSLTLSTLSVTGSNPSSGPASVQLNGMTLNAGATQSVSVDTASSGFYFAHGVPYQATIVTSVANVTFAITY